MSAYILLFNVAVNPPQLLSHRATNDLWAKTPKGWRIKQRVNSTIGSNTPFATYTFQDVLITADVLGSSQNVVSEQVAIDFTKIITHIVFGGMVFDSCFDIKANVVC